MKKIHTINVDEKNYKDFKVYSIIIGKSVSSLIEEFMKNILKKQKNN